MYLSERRVGGGVECVHCFCPLLLNDCHPLLHFVPDKIGALAIPLSMEGPCSDR